MCVHQQAGRLPQPACPASPAASDRGSGTVAGAESFGPGAAPAIAGGIVQRRVALAVPGLHVGAGPQQLLGDRHVSAHLPAGHANGNLLNATEC